MYTVTVSILQFSVHDIWNDGISISMQYLACNALQLHYSVTAVVQLHYSVTAPPIV